MKAWPRICDGRERFKFFPQSRRSNGRRYIYALGLSDGRTKIGACHHPRGRFVQHWKDNGGGVTWMHLFARFDGAHAIELDALRRAGLVGERVGRTETFSNLSREDALRCVRDAINDHLITRGRQRWYADVGMVEA